MRNWIRAHVEQVHESGKVNAGAFREPPYSSPARWHLGRCGPLVSPGAVGVKQLRLVGQRSATRVCAEGTEGRRDRNRSAAKVATSVLASCPEASRTSADGTW